MVLAIGPFLPLSSGDGQAIDGGKKAKKAGMKRRLPVWRWCWLSLQQGRRNHVFLLSPHTTTTLYSRNNAERPYYAAEG